MHLFFYLSIIEYLIKIVEFENRAFKGLSVTQQTKLIELIIFL